MGNPAEKTTEGPAKFNYQRRPLPACGITRFTYLATLNPARTVISQTTSTPSNCRPAYSQARLTLSRYLRILSNVGRLSTGKVGGDRVLLVKKPSARRKAQDYLRQPLRSETLGNRWRSLLRKAIA
jgi:hypothetical protein